ncbi:MAG: hypothetical protein KDC35_08375 [Acidobacteria bacterium]|nr:hypothetical protein [Acidobacteriota bacterium]
MTAITVYKLIHFVGLFTVLMAFGGLLSHLRNGGSKENPSRKAFAMSHGIGLLLMLVGGFGLLARMGIHWPLPGWVFGKIVIWLVLAGMLPMSYKMKDKARGLWWVVLILCGLAAFLASSKII